MEAERPLRPAGSNWIWFALVVSIGLNLFAAGWWFGSVVRPSMDGLRFAPPPPWPGPPPEGGPRRHPFGALLRRLDGKLSPEGMREVADAVEAIDAHFVRGFAASAEARERARQMLAADPFDAEAFTKAIGDLQAQRFAGEAELTREIVQRISKLSLADRKALADATVFIPPP
jgi:uncharacterized membrane protein